MKHPLGVDRHPVSCPLAFKNLSTQVPWGSSRMSFGFNLADSLHGWCSSLDENTGRTHKNWAGIWAENEFSWDYAEFKIYGGDQDRLLKRQLNMLVWSSQEWLLKCGGLQIWELLAANLPLNMVRVKGGLKTAKVNNPSLKHVSFWFACHRILWQ